MAGPVPLQIEQRPHTLTLAALEFNSIAAGLLTLDAVLKEAPVNVLLAQPSSAGKYLILFSGEVEEAVESMGQGVHTAADALIDEILLPAAAPTVWDALTANASVESLLPHGNAHGEDLPALAILETFGAPTLLGAVDSAAKTGEISVEEIHLLQGIGGKATTLFSGDLESVRMALGAGAEFAAERELLAREVLIPRPAPGMLPFLRREQ